MTKNRWTGLAGRWSLPIVLATAGLGALTGCGGDERLSRDEFGDRLQSIDRQGSARYERLAEKAMRLKPDQPLTDELKQGMRQYSRMLVRAADRLEGLNPPSDAQDETAKLTEALRERAETFAQAPRGQRVTLRQLERQGSSTKAGEKIDRAFEQLRQEGFLRQDSPTGPHDR